MAEQQDKVFGHLRCRGSPSSDPNQWEHVTEGSPFMYEHIQVDSPSTNTESHTGQVIVAGNHEFVRVDKSSEKNPHESTDNNSIPLNSTVASVFSVPPQNEIIMGYNDTENIIKTRKPEDLITRNRRNKKQSVKRGKLKTQLLLRPFQDLSSYSPLFERSGKKRNTEDVTAPYASMGESNTTYEPLHFPDNPFVILSSEEESKNSKTITTVKKQSPPTVSTQNRERFSPSTTFVSPFAVKKENRDTVMAKTPKIEETQQPKKDIPSFVFKPKPKAALIHDKARHDVFSLLPSLATYSSSDEQIIPKKKSREEMLKEPAKVVPDIGEYKAPKEDGDSMEESGLEESVVAKFSEDNESCKDKYQPGNELTDFASICEELSPSDEASDEENSRKSEFSHESFESDSLSRDDFDSNTFCKSSSDEVLLRKRSRDDIEHIPLGGTSTNLLNKFPNKQAKYTDKGFSISSSNSDDENPVLSMEDRSEESEDMDSEERGEYSSIEQDSLEEESRSFESEQEAPESDSDGIIILDSSDEEADSPVQKDEEVVMSTLPDSPYAESSTGEAAQIPEPLSEEYQLRKQYLDELESMLQISERQVLQVFEFLIQEVEIYIPAANSIIIAAKEQFSCLCDITREMSVRQEDLRRYIRLTIYYFVKLLRIRIQLPREKQTNLQQELIAKIHRHQDELYFLQQILSRSPKDIDSFKSQAYSALQENVNLIHRYRNQLAISKASSS